MKAEITGCDEGSSAMKAEVTGCDEGFCNEGRNHRVR